MGTDPDFELVDRIIAGEESFYATLVDRYKRYVFTIACRILLNKDDAEEAAQDTFIRAYQNLRAFGRQAKFSTWLYRIAVNTAITHRRKQRRREMRSIEGTEVPIHPDAEGRVELRDRKAFLTAAIARLNEHDRTALTLFYLKEFSLEEIGEIMNMQPNTVKVRIHRARLRVAEELKNILKEEALTL